MSPEDIEKLLEDGLTLYGYGKTDDAIILWRKVLEIDPDNQKAIDYIQSAGYTGEQKAAEVHRVTTKDAEFININYIRDLLKSRRFELAYEFLEHLVEKDYSSNRQIMAYISLVKAQLIKIYNEELYNFKKVPKLNIKEQDIVKYNLDKSDGYIISMIDGYSSMEEIMQTISTVDRFELMKRFYKLTKLGITGF